MKTWLLAGGFLLVVVAVAVWYAYSSPLRISVSEAKRRIRDFDRIVDVRTDLEVKTLGSYPNSIHIPAAELPVRAAAQLKKTDRILVYCNTGQRARMAAETLQSLGYPNVRYIAGSYTGLL